MTICAYYVTIIFECVSSLVFSHGWLLAFFPLIHCSETDCFSVLCVDHLQFDGLNDMTHINIFSNIK